MIIAVRCRENVGVTVVVVVAVAVREFPPVVADATATAADRVGRTSRRAGNKVVFDQKHCCFQCRRREHPFERHFIVVVVVVVF